LNVSSSTTAKTDTMLASTTAVASREVYGGTNDYHPAAVRGHQAMRKDTVPLTTAMAAGNRAARQNAARTPPLPAVQVCPMPAAQRAQQGAALPGPNRPGRERRGRIWCPPNKAKADRVVSCDVS
jgi:hypothetical protein